MKTPVKLLRFHELAHTRGITYSIRHLARLEVEGQFPKRVPFGVRRVGWKEAEIDDWLAKKIAARDGRLMQWPRG